MQRRLAEVEDLLVEKNNKLEQAQKELNETLGQFNGMQSALTMFEQKNKKLVTDNQEYVKQIIEMKESRAQMMNDCLSGKMSSEVSKLNVYTLTITHMINFCIGWRADSEQDVRGRVKTWIDHQT